MAPELDFTPVEGMTEEDVLEKYLTLESEALTEGLTTLLGLLREQGTEIHFPHDENSLRSLLTDIIRMERVLIVERVVDFIEGLLYPSAKEQLVILGTDEGLKSLAGGLSDVIQLGSVSFDEALDYSNSIRLVHVRDCADCRSGETVHVIGDPDSPLFSRS